jgi:hypothetical protein
MSNSSLTIAQQDTPAQAPWSDTPPGGGGFEAVDAALTQAPSLTAIKYPTPPPVGKPQDPPPPPTAWEVAADYCYRLGLAYDRANEIAAALRHAWYSSGSRDAALYATYRQAATAAEALGNDYAAADRAATRLLVPGLRR